MALRLLLPCNKSREDTKRRSSMTDERWGLILAGGEGSRLRPMTLRIEGDDRPKQFCRVLGGATLLEETRRRAALLLPPDQTLIVVTRPHERFYASLLATAPAGCVVVQPESRGTAAAILYGLLRIAAKAPTAALALLPSDHYVSDDAAFMAHVDVAFEAVGARPDLVVLLGFEPDRPEPEYGWIEPGDPVEGGRWSGLFRVRRFWEKPHRSLAEKLLAGGGLWNSFVIVARVTALLALIRASVPALYKAFMGGLPAINRAREAEAFRAVYRRIPSMNFSEAVLARRPSNLAVLKVSGVVWNDLGDPARVRATLARAGIEPEWARPAALA
jgi:mannose-1-phosphate guanylyltransferase